MREDEKTPLKQGVTCSHVNPTVDKLVKRKKKKTLLTSMGLYHPFLSCLQWTCNGYRWSTTSWWMVVIEREKSRCHNTSYNSLFVVFVNSHIRSHDRPFSLWLIDQIIFISLSFITVLACFTTNKPWKSTVARPARMELRYSHRWCSAIHCSLRPDVASKLDILYM